MKMVRYDRLSQSLSKNRQIDTICIAVPSQVTL